MFADHEAVNHFHRYGSEWMLMQNPSSAISALKGRRLLSILRIGS